MTTIRCGESKHGARHFGDAALCVALQPLNTEYIMKKLIFILLPVVVLLSACGNDEAEKTTETGGQNPEELARLKQENENLKVQLAQRDSAINESVGLISDIEANLTQIASSQGRIRAQNTENQEDAKQFILGEIETINQLRENNQRKIAKLNKQLEESGLQNTELKKLVESLTAQIAAQEIEIEGLKAELEKLDAEYTELFEAYVEVAEIAESREAELNTAWYAYGTSKELKENGVITKEGGFVGLGKIEKLRQDFNKDYFEQIDINQTKEISIAGQKVRMMTTHPANTYELVPSGTKTLLKIKDSKAFWSVSKYLVVIVD
jgi:DNA repair exonuclease SbcCD ATPase subunit